jgi:hypothetical protein
MSGFDASWGRPRPGMRLAVAVLLLVAASFGAASASVLILPLGDSITHGGHGDGGVLFPTYRAWLYQDLEKLGYDVDFVGSLDQPAPPAGCDPHNEGHAAYTAGQVLAELPGWLEAYPPPAVALVHLGTNDAIHGVPVDRTIADLRGIVGALRTRNPSMTILVAQIVPTSVASINTRIEALNREIAGLEALSTPQSPIVVVDQYAGYDGVADNQKGGVHPLSSGEQKMTAQWEIALVPILARGAHAVVTMAPVTTPTTVTTVPATDPAVVTTLPTTVPPVTTPTATSRFGARSYRIGSIPTRTLSGSAAPTLTGPTGLRRFSVSGAATAITPPARPFARWYPAARWSAGLR